MSNRVKQKSNLNSSKGDTMVIINLTKGPKYNPSFEPWINNHDLICWAHSWPQDCYIWIPCTHLVGGRLVGMEEAVEQCQEEMSCDLLNAMILDLASQMTRVWTRRCNWFLISSRLTTSVWSRASTGATISNCTSKTYWLPIYCCDSWCQLHPIDFREAVWNSSFWARST